jgi:hypothetical protein
MGFQWKGAVSGGIDGAEMGTEVCPGWGTLIGGVAGAAAGGYAKDWDKDLTGNSKSGTVEGLLDTGGSATEGFKGSTATDLFSMFDKNSDKDGNLNTGNIGSLNGQPLTHNGNGDFSLGNTDGLNINQLLQMVHSSGGSGGGGLGNLFSSGGGGGDSLPSDAGISFE